MRLHIFGQVVAGGADCVRFAYFGQVVAGGTYCVRLLHILGRLLQVVQLVAGCCRFDTFQENTIDRKREIQVT